MFGFNELKQSKDSRKKGGILALDFVYLFLGLFVVLYMTVMDTAFVSMKMTERVPIYNFAIGSLMILFFSIFKTGNVIFQMKGYDILMSLPVTQASIVISRFMSMYIPNLVLSMLVMIPSLTITGGMLNLGVSFYLYGVLGILVLPLLPITLATLIGALITGISARLKYKSLISAGLMLLFAFACMVFSFKTASINPWDSGDLLKNLSDAAATQIQRLYPPATWFGKSAMDGNILYFLLLFVVSVVIFTIMVAIVQRYFASICNALNVTSAKNNYQLKTLRTRSLRKALYIKEWKRYISSGIYVANTAMGFVMMLIFGIALLAVGVEKIESLFRIQGAIMVSLPFMLAAFIAISSTTCSSISMEGKHWWLTKSLPFTTRQVLDSKILVELTIALPCYIVTEVCCFLRVDTDFKGHLWIILVPLVYLLFTSVIGITINLALPVFDWDNEAKVVKQSGATLICMIIGFGSFLIPLVFQFVTLGKYQNECALTAVIVLGVATVFFYFLNNRVVLNRIGE